MFLWHPITSLMILSCAAVQHDNQESITRFSSRTHPSTRYSSKHPPRLGPDVHHWVSGILFTARNISITFHLLILNTSSIQASYTLYYSCNVSHIECRHTEVLRADEFREISPDEDHIHKDLHGFHCKMPLVDARAGASEGKGSGDYIWRAGGHNQLGVPVSGVDANV